MRFATARRKLLSARWLQSQTTSELLGSQIGMPSALVKGAKRENEKRSKVQQEAGHDSSTRSYDVRDLPNY
jgi:hypothetical protein